MSFEKPVLQRSNPFKYVDSNYTITRSIYYAEVISIDDETEGGRIKVKIPDLDNKTANTDLPWCYPLLPKFFHLYPKVGEMIRVFIEDTKYPERGRFWLGSIISQPQKIGFDSIYTALSTTNMGIIAPEAAPHTCADATGVFPLKTDVAIVGRVNTDIILRNNEMHLRVGKHENDDIFKLNKKNPAQISMVFESSKESVGYSSNTIVMSDKIALISHAGNPKFKSVNLETKDRENIFAKGHPIARGDVLVEALNIIRNALIAHIHGYSGLPADKDEIISALMKIDFTNILQKDVVTN